MQIRIFLRSLNEVLRALSFQAVELPELVLKKIKGVKNTMKESHHGFSLRELDQMQLHRIRTVKRIWGSFRENLDRAARNLKVIKNPQKLTVLARGYYAILAHAGWDQQREEAAWI